MVVNGMVLYIYIVMVGVLLVGLSLNIIIGVFLGMFIVGGMFNFIIMVMDVNSFMVSWGYSVIIGVFMVMVNLVVVNLV